MTWQLGAMTIMAVALAGGFAWYERSHPDARTVALVATMAALAALGRIAFAAVPNVKPSTDIVLITGFALGAAPGFMVGALTGLVSNFFFGQGPWTVWQMGGWAITGVLGAGLARVTLGRVGRWPLAIVCMAVGYAFTAAQDVGDWVNYSDHSLPALGAYVGQGTGFDLVHAGGCLLFALAFGPALMRSLMRFRQRLEVTWVAPAAAMAVAMALLGAGAGTLAPDAARAGATPTGYLLSAQNHDGGFGPAPGTASSPLFSGWAALGLAAEGINPGDVRRGGATLLQYVAANTGSDVGSLERTILVARAAGASPYGFGGRNLVASVQRAIAADGAVSNQVNLTTFAVLALRAASAPVPGRTLDWLAAQQNGDGGFGFGTAGGASDPDDTGAALEALAGSGAGGTINRAVGFLRAAQNGDGGLPAQRGGESDAQSTAWAIQGLLAVGVNPDAVHHGGSRSPMAYLQSLIAPDGHVRYAQGSDTTPVWVTAEAIMALARRPLPLGPVRAAAGAGGPAGTGAAGGGGGLAAGQTTSRAGGSATGAATGTITANGASTAAQSPARARAAARRSRLGPAPASWLTPMAMGDERAILAAVARVLRPVGVRLAVASASARTGQGAASASARAGQVAASASARAGQVAPSGRARTGQLAAPARARARPATASARRVRGQQAAPGY